MAKSKRPHIYFCHNCKGVFHHIDDLFVIEESLKRTFCSDACIVEFFATLVAHMEKEELEIRKNLGLSKEECIKYKRDPNIVKSTLDAPDEIWCDINDVGEEFFFFNRRYDRGEGPFWMIVMCYLYRGAPSFVFFQTATHSEAMLNEYRSGHKIEDMNIHGSEELPEQESPLHEVQLPPEAMDELDVKKSSHLARLLEQKSEADIALEQFPLYERYLKGTLEYPDEVYETRDDDGDNVFTYLRSFQEKGTSFTYIAVCMKLRMKGAPESDEMIFPILSFPSVDQALVKKYGQGKKLSGGTGPLN